MRKFYPDIRNSGGRKAICDLHRAHQENLQNARPTLETRSRARSGSLERRRIGLMDGGFHITKLNKNLLSEHSVNIKHMKRRIQSIGSYIERKKNPYDPITHPVLFFRSCNEKDHPVLSKGFINRSVKPPKDINIYSDAKEKRAESRMGVMIEVPYIEESGKNTAQKLKGKLIEVIVKNRIFREEDIQELFKSTREANFHLDQNVLENAISLTYQELNS